MLIFHFLKVLCSVLERNEDSRPNGWVCARSPAQPLGASPPPPTLDFDFCFFYFFMTIFVL